MAVDVPRRLPATGDLFVLWDGSWLVVKRIETVCGDGPPRLRPRFANPDYTSDAGGAEAAHIVDTVVWTISRA